MSLSALGGKRVLLGISGSIAAYKAAELTRLLVKAEATVDVIMTRSACELVRPLLFMNLTGRRVGTGLFDEDGTFQHLDAARAADLAVIAPATANILAKLAHGLADDLLSTSMLAVQAPVLLAPAMNSRMIAHPAVQANLATLRGYGHQICEPDAGELACGDVGPGRLAAPHRIAAQLAALAAASAS